MQMWHVNSQYVLLLHEIHIGVGVRLTWSCLRQIYEITENDQNIYKPWIGSPDDYL